MTQLAKNDEPALPVVQTESAAMFNLIERMASDPSIDLDCVERVIAMRDKMQDQSAERAFNSAMALAQSDMGPVAVNASNPQTRSRYASLDQLDRALRPIYTKHGFALSFDEADSPKPDHVRILCMVSHRDGYVRTYHADMDVSGKGAKGGDVMTKNHAIGAASSYGMRYLLRRIFNVATGEGDVDGNETGEVISDAQRDELLVLAAEVKADIPKFCQYLKVDAIADISAKNFTRAKAALEAKRAKA